MTTPLGRPLVYLSILSQKIVVCLSNLWKPNSPHLPLPSQKIFGPSQSIAPSRIFGWAPALFHPSGIPVLVQSYSLMQWISDAIIRVNCKTGIYENPSCRFKLTIYTLSGASVSVFEYLLHKFAWYETKIMFRFFLSPANWNDAQEMWTFMHSKMLCQLTNTEIQVK